VFTLVAVASLALGIGANTAIFSILDQVLLRPVAVRNPGELVLLDSPGLLGREFSRGPYSFSYPTYRDLRDGSQAFTGLVARYHVPLTLSAGGHSERVAGELVSGNFFEVLGVGARLGRTLTPADDVKPGAHPVAVLSHDFWVRRFGSDPGVLGRAIRINGYAFTIVGVTQAGFGGVQMGVVPAIYLPIMMKAAATPAWDELHNRRGHWLNIIGRLHPGVTPEQARASLEPLHRSTLERRLEQIGSGVPSRLREQILAQPLFLLPGAGGVPVLRREARAPLTVLLAATGLVLLIACANVAGLMIARSVHRRHEMAVRRALGASGLRLMMPLLVESLVLVVLGALGGLLLAAWLRHGIFSLILDAGVPARIGIDASLDARALWFNLGVAALTGLLFGLAPARWASRENIVRGAATASPGSACLRKVLVAAQIALSLFLLVMAGLFARTLARLGAVDPGFPTDRLLSFQVDARSSGYPADQVYRLYERLRSHFAGLPGVGAVSISDNTVLAMDGWSARVRVHGYQPQEGEDMEPFFDLVSPGYFKALELPLLAGREFTEADHARARRVAVVNETFARYFFGTSDPLGRRFDNDFDRDIEIVGVVRGGPYMHLREPARRRAFLPYLQRSGVGQVTFYVRTATTPESMFQTLRRELAAAASGLPMFNERTVEEHIRITLTGERLVAWLCSAFAVLAALLSAIGLYGLVSYTVAARTREFGVRMALGADGGRMLRMVMGEVATLTAAGGAVGLALVLALGPVIRSQLFGLEPYDPATLAGACFLLSAVVFAAGARPAWTAARINPVVALRHE
jgi:predicted permease